MKHVTIFRSTAAAFACSTLVASAQEGDPGGMMAAQGCMLLEAAGSANVTIDSEPRQAEAVYKPGPNGEAFVVIGELEGANPIWCLTILTAVPVDGQTLEVSPPDTVVQSKSGAMVVMATPAKDGDQGSYFRASEGSVSFQAGDNLIGQIDVQGVTEIAESESAGTINGSFEAAALD